MNFVGGVGPFGFNEATKPVKNDPQSLMKAKYGDICDLRQATKVFFPILEIRALHLHVKANWSF